ncbi:hybrid sensor histidine kinase/response regulator [Bordetella genomosp. 13]|uniref:histidine kinase n=1 Tax=Bordetella genomosp. 13 TaxID=463040 RepID=A0A1W6ZA08_9BORD|nr:hybrid sensor histidine kinase/response regulator [Bordetella genomosp. 13]ARP94157.1 hybrid sensor histidine kinase/response regulator [Bordetella genomosp. 13]
MSSDINILVVDDVEQNLIAMEAVLARPGLRIRKASSGVEALEILLAEDVALALVDVQMPQMDGFELAELIRGSERTRNIPLIFLTAAALDRDHYFRGYEAGAVDFLYKPIDPRVLGSKVNVFVELYTQRATLDSQLQALRRALHLNELFTAVLGHDLRNPLSAVMNASAILTKLSEHPMAVSAAQRIQQTTVRMSKMVEQLLDVARIRSSGLVLQVRSTDYAEVCRHIVEELSVAAPERVRLEVRGDVMGEADPDRLAQVVSNLVGNALQHGEADSPIWVEVDGNHAERLTVRVSNRGVIPQHQLYKVFEPFQSGVLQRGPDHGQGLGLGLYIVKSFVEAHGGKVGAQSAAPQGTEFHFTIPRRVPAGGAPQADPLGLRAAGLAPEAVPAIAPAISRRPAP